MKKAKRVLAIIGLVLIAFMYVMTVVFALIGSPDSKKWLMAAIFCTIAVPVIVYGIQLLAKLRKPKDDTED